jgi:hypothetical protein
MIVAAFTSGESTQEGATDGVDNRSKQIYRYAHLLGQKGIRLIFRNLNRHVGFDARRGVRVFPNIRVRRWAARVNYGGDANDLGDVGKRTLKEHLFFLTSTGTAESI